MQTNVPLTEDEQKLLNQYANKSRQMDTEIEKEQKDVRNYD